MNYRNLQKEFRSLGCTDEAQTTAACQLYIELCEVRQKINVKYHYNAEYNLVYLTEASETDQVESIYLVSASSAALNVTATERTRKALLQTHAHECSCPDKVQLILAIVDSNTTVVYYKLTHGLINFDSLREERKSTRSKRSGNPKNISMNITQNPTTSA